MRYFPDSRTFPNMSGQLIDTGLAGIETVSAGTSSATSDHLENYFGVLQLHQTIVDIANVVRNATGGLVRVNDMSLVTGGTFDFQDTWRPPHSRHRRGARGGLASAKPSNRLSITLALDPNATVEAPNRST